MSDKMRIEELSHELAVATDVHKNLVEESEQLKSDLAVAKSLWKVEMKMRMELEAVRTKDMVTDWLVKLDEADRRARASKEFLSPGFVERDELLLKHARVLIDGEKHKRVLAAASVEIGGEPFGCQKVVASYIGKLRALLRRRAVAWDGQNHRCTECDCVVSTKLHDPSNPVCRNTNCKLADVLFSSGV